MARTIDYLTCMVDVTPYEHEGHNYDALNIIVAYRKGQGFCITWQPVKVEPMGYMTGPMPSSDPLVGGKGFVAKAANRNNVKVLEQIRANLLAGKEGIRFFFDHRNYDGLKEFMGDVANYGYTYDAEKQLKETIDRFNAMSNAHEEKAKNTDLSPKMRQFHDLKSKHPEALLLFRCGDFYEAYEDDAMECVRILGISLAKEKANGHPYDMVGFPYHALDAYLPKLVRSGRRIAICDQLEAPKPTKKRITEILNPKNDETMKLNIKNNKKSTPKNETPNFSVVTYTTKKGGTAGYLMGFKDEQAAKVVADAACKTVGVTWRYNDQGAKVYGLSFGTRYMDVARALCEALNKGDKAAVSKAIAKTHDIYAAAVETGKAEREANRKAKKAEEAKAKAKELAKVKKANGLYSMEDIAAMMKRAMAGEDVPELAAVKEALAAAA